METIPRTAYKTAVILPLVLLISLVLSACSGSQQIDSVAEIDSTTIEPLTTATVPAKTPTATPSPTVTSTATIAPSPTLTPSPTPFPGPSDAEYNMLTCKAVGGVQGFVNFDGSEERVIDGLEEVVEPAFYEFYGGSDNLLHDVWSHFYQQVGDGPTDTEGNLIPYGAFGDTNYDICLKEGVSDPEIVEANLIIPQIQSVDTIKAACMNQNANGLVGQKASQITTFSTLNAGEDGILASEALAGVELSDCYGFIGGAQTPWENAVAHLINGQYAKPVFNDLNDSIPDDALLKPQTYQIFTHENDKICSSELPQLSLPVDNPVCYTGFGEPKDYGPHKGHDFAVAPGSYGYAVTDGTVYRVVDLPSARSGQQLVIDHGCYSQLDGSYAELLSIVGHGESLVKIGDRVDKGQPVAISDAEIEFQLALVPLSTDIKQDTSWLGDFANRIDPGLFFDYSCN